MIKFEVPEDGQSVYEIRTKSGQSSVGLRICRGTAGLDEADEDLIDLGAEPVSCVGDGANVGEFPCDGAAENRIQLIETLASGDNALASPGQ
ncbi:hypothetical protein GPK52_04740 [Sutterella wadsworthensis]|uniref:hypothetical protein n=1 Tax=Sutterella wadsworthensis TaxID=40545 RepID=UPI001C02700D|nr:hypothetical protein [Sutterella wadsworthensis]MBT9622314.1 hypothetical protein [Sutterella wadsworthensis]